MTNWKGHRRKRPWHNTGGTDENHDKVVGILDHRPEMKNESVTLLAAAFGTRMKITRIRTRYLNSACNACRTPFYSCQCMKSESKCGLSVCEVRNPHFDAKVLP